MKENIGKYALVLDSVVTGFTNKIGKIIEYDQDHAGKRYTLKFPIAIPPHNIDILHPPCFMVEVINKIYTQEDCDKIKTDLDVMYLPKRIWCDSSETLSRICKRLSECHIGTSCNNKLLFIQT